MSTRKKVTSGLLLGLMSLAGVSIYDDYLIYQQCSKYVKHFHVLCHASNFFFTVGCFVGDDDGRMFLLIVFGFWLLVVGSRGMNLLILFFVVDLFEEECDVMKEWVLLCKKKQMAAPYCLSTGMKA
jgi:hypothetical protein